MRPAQVCAADAASPGPGPLFGLYLPQLRMDFEVIEARVRDAEESGFHSAWFMDHLAAPAAPQWDTLEAWTVASAMAARTSRIRLGHLVLCEAFRHPALLAKMAATLDVISGGRLELGLGWGSVPSELRAFGFGTQAASVRAGRLAETLEILELLFGGEPVTYAGTHYQLEGALCRPTPVRGRLPIHIGGAGKRLTLPLVARHADWWNCPAYGLPRLADLLPLIGHARVSVQHPIGLAPTSDSREATAGVTMRRFGSWGGVVTGTPEEVTATLAKEVALGVELFILQFHDFGEPATLRLFSNEVMPALAHRGDPSA